ncbi:hypothetical protein [Ramlibacter sp.]|uniref:hypothetical protein n=1 Tax=Ramlibacter sp. TaxID=1917967 RepID=UPI003D0FDEF5
MAGAGKKALALAVGIGGGYLDAQERDRKIKLEDEDRQMRRESHDITIADSQARRRIAERAEADQVALRAAAQPAEVSLAGPLPEGLQYGSNEDAEAGTSMPPTPAYRVASGTGAERFDTLEAADAAAAKHNDPIALSQRITGALNAQGKPVEAMQYQSQVEKFASERWNKKLREAIGQGHAGLAQLVSESEAGPFKGKRLQPVPSADGKSVTYSLVGEDGTTTPTRFTFPNDQNGVIQAGYMLDQTVTPETRYKYMVEEDKRRSDNAFKERDLALKTDIYNNITLPATEAKIALANSQATAAETRANAAAARAAGGGGGSDKVSREERLRWTSLHGEAGRRLSEAQKALTKLQTDSAFMRKASTPGTAQAGELEQLKSEIEAHKGDREMYGSLLAGSQGAEAREKRDAQRSPKSAAAQAPSAGAAAPSPKSRAEYDKLPSGTKYRHPDGTMKVKP